VAAHRSDQPDDADDSGAPDSSYAHDDEAQGDVARDDGPAPDLHAPTTEAFPVYAHPADTGPSTAYPPPTAGRGLPLVEAEMQAPAPTAPRGLRLPGWLLPTVAALVAGVLIGVFLSRGQETPAPAPVAAAGVPVAEPVPVSATVVPALTHSEPVQIDVPAIEVTSPLVDLGLLEDGTLETPLNYAKAGWFAGGNLPGDPQGRPAVIAGHVDDHTGPAVFFRLRELVAGDEVEVLRADNTVAVFTVTESQQYPKSEFPSEQVYAPVGDSEIVLITCTGDFDEDVRSYRDNLVVRATLDLERSVEESEARVAEGLTAPRGNLPNS
jgi:LPXTG-site transpeptidase (sortase) family protein